MVIAWQGGTILSLAVVLLLVLHERRVPLGVTSLALVALTTIALLATEPLSGSLFFGQINLFLMLLAAVDILPRRWRLPGIGVGLAAGIKLTPAYLGLVFLLERRWGAAVGSVVTFLATVAIGFLGVPDAYSYWTEKMLNSSRIGDHLNPGAQSLRPVFDREFGIDSTLVWILAVLVVTAVAAAAVGQAVARDDRTTALSLAGIGACLVSPFSWFHHWVWVLPMAFGFMIGVNRFLADRWTFTGGHQLAGAASVAALVLPLVPFVSHVMIDAAQSRFYTAAGFAFLVCYLVGSLISSRVAAPSPH
ncbi:putative DUF2029 family protein [Corynebacterium uterequi]|uniref:Putative DUF2029 family protein n=1 Tax=Corynebacterium uterequi TaxID=1072256 RepID=A0A0G3HDC6_9CORY|nr:putative DUF2029 family protein [Corynebacterium uterequi]